MELGIDDNQGRQKQSKAAESVNAIANTFWYVACISSDTIAHPYLRFAQIVSISMTDKSTTFHVRWFEHASRTSLGETSSPQELFLTDECDNIDARTVVARAQVRFLPVGTPEPMDDLEPDRFFYRSVAQKTSPNSSLISSLM